MTASPFWDDIVSHEFPLPFGWGTAHLQTARNQLRPRRYDLDSLGRVRRLLIGLGDGTSDRVAVSLHHSAAAPKTSSVRLAVLLHGLGGSAESVYIRATAFALLRAGYDVARVDLRGAGRSIEHSTDLYHAGRTEDVRAVLRALALAHTPDSPQAPPMALIGFSLGANVTLKTLGEPLDGVPLRAGVAVSSPLDLAVGVSHLHHVLFGFYERVLLRGLRRDAMRNQRALSDLERRLVRRVRRIEEFDDVITARRNGWRDASEYYAANSSSAYLHRIRTPTLVIHALDDPLIPAGPYLSIDWDGLRRQGYVSHAITARGGHVGFHERGSKAPWYVGQILRFLGGIR